MLTSIKAPGTLSYRGSRAEIGAEKDEAMRFFEHIKAEVLKDLKATDPDTPRQYLDEAMSRVRFVYSVGNDRPRYTSAPEHRQIWKHVFAFGSDNYNLTNMVIRKDGTVNVERLSDMVRQKAWAERAADKAKAAQAKVAASIEGIEAPEGYEIEPSPSGVYVRYVGEHCYKTAAKLYTRVAADRILPLIHAHQRWVEDFITCTKR